MRASAAIEQQPVGRVPSPITGAAPKLTWPLVGIILAVAAAPRLALAVGDQGILWPDEIFQSLEQSHRVVFGYGFIPWEFQDGARSWLFPGIFAVLWKAAALLGVQSGPMLLLLAKLTMVALALMGIYAAMRIAERLAGPIAGALAGFLCATFPALLIYGHRCMAEMAGASVVALSVWLWLHEDRRRMFFAGLLASVAIFLRYQNGLVAVGLLAALLLSSRRRQALPFLAGGALGLLLGELLDWVTWGRPFHSLVAYLRFNLFLGRSTEFGSSPWWYYLQTAWTSTGVSLVLVALGIMAAWRRAPALVAIVVAFVLAHSVIPHKEFRFLMPVVPLLVALSSVGLVVLLGRLLPSGPSEPIGGPRPNANAKPKARKADRVAHKNRSVPPLRRHLSITAAAAVVGVAASMLMADRAVEATLSTTGQWADSDEGAESVWHHWEGANLALQEAGQRADVCGVLLTGLGAVWSGGFTYLHRDVPFMALEDTSFGGDLLPFANYVILPPNAESPPHYVRLRTFRGWSLLRRDDGCSPPPPQFTRLFRMPASP